MVLNSQARLADGHAAHSLRRVEKPGHGLRGLEGGIDLREHDPLGAEIEHAVGALALVRLDAHDDARGGGLERLELGQDVRFGAAAVLEVDDGEVVAGAAHDLGGEGGAEVQKAAQQGLAVVESLFEVLHPHRVYLQPRLSPGLPESTIPAVRQTVDSRFGRRSTRRIVPAMTTKLTVASRACAPT